jgi:hypothetical protein
MRLSATAIGTACLLMAAQPAAAQECIAPSQGPNFAAEQVAAYATGISPADLVDARGVALSNAEAVLRRERENHHAEPGRGEETDNLFGDPANLRLFDGAGLVFYCNWSKQDADSLVRSILAADLESRVHVTVYVRPNGNVLLHIESWG